MFPPFYDVGAPCPAAADGVAAEGVVSFKAKGSLSTFRERPHVSRKAKLSK